MVVGCAEIGLDGVDYVHDGSVAVLPASDDLYRRLRKTTCGNGVSCEINPIGMRADVDGIELIAHEELLERVEEDGLASQGEILLRHAFDVHARADAAGQDGPENHDAPRVVVFPVGRTAKRSVPRWESVYCTI